MVEPVTFDSNCELCSTSELLEIAEPSAKHSPAIARVTSGPATATRNSTPGDVDSRPSFATPPNIHRSMPRIGIPFRIATQAWPSSCSRIERKKRSALRTASTNAFDAGGRVLVVVGQVPDDQEEDEEPAEVHPDPDPEDPAQLKGAAEHRSGW